ncbi:hypothetical protein [Rhodopseudomonas sp. B29]|uniref:hypothetical protein n=1 Tax=Rhodopseudomonas sp. B29 TaxID=95607 RepID=UPI00034D28EB|nr:hypothetical protein [Rhodopseudomonas sp. B29]
MATSIRPGGRDRSASATTGSALPDLTIDELAGTINLAMEQAERLGIASAAQLLMMARLEVDLTELALTSGRKEAS